MAKLSSKEYARKYYAEHREKIQAYEKQKRTVFRAKSTLRHSRYYAKKHGTKPLICSELWLQNKLDTTHICEFPGCGRSLDGKNKAVDHDHKTGLFRGILCNLCNSRVVGTIEKYLEKYMEYIK